MNNLKKILWLVLLSLTTAGATFQPRDDCNANNCLRALRATARSADSHAFCSEYIDLTTRTITLIDIIPTTLPPSTTTVPSTIFSTVETTIYMTTTATLVQTDTTTTTVTQLTNLVLRDTTPTVPAHLSACSGSPSKLSSACSCYIGTTASDQFTTETSFVITGPLSTETVTSTTVIYVSETDYTTVTETYFSTTTTTSTVYSTPSLTCHGNTEDLSSVFLRIEGATDTIFEGSVISGPRNITTPSGGTHHCDGTNNGNNPKSGATCTTALDEAACRFGFPYDGSWSPAFDDFFITSIDDSTQTSTQFWGLLLNYQFTPVGGCQQKTQPSDNVLWAYDAFNAVNFLQASPNSDFSTMTGVGNVGVQKYLYVRDGSTSTPISGASIAGAITDANGRATVSFTMAGTFSFKATKSGSIRSNAVKIIVGSN